MKYAFLSNGIVVSIGSNLDDYSGQYEQLVDITYITPEPQLGWVLEGNKLVPVLSGSQQRQQQEFGATLALELVNRMGARNLELSMKGVSVNIPNLLSALYPIKSLIETGALKTARTSLSYYIPNFPNHSDILQYAIDSITQFLQSKNWD